MGNMTKSQIRKSILELRDSLSDYQIREKSRVIFEKITASKEYQNCENLLVFASFGTEVSTLELIIDALVSGKKVFCPKVTDKKLGKMEFLRISSVDDLVPGYYNIPEPEFLADSEVFDTGDKSEVEKSLVIMPGVAFDMSCNRIGYSGGYYDRYLAKISTVRKIAICFREQLTDYAIPADSHDIKPDRVIFD